MDCWDGQDGEPVIYHGWTLTSQLNFKEVIEQGIKPYAFSASKYPLILSIENHCSKTQQDKMAEHLTNILGHLLYKEKVDTSLRNLPSPEFFMEKILIKAKKQKEFRLGSSRHLNSGRSVQSSSNIFNDFSKTSCRSLEEADSVKERKFSNESEVNRLSVSTKSKALSDIVNYTEAVKFKSFGEPRQFWEMSSFEETKISNILKDETTHSQLTQYTEKNLCRIYPKGSRLFSSNLSKRRIVKL